MKLFPECAFNFNSKSEYFHETINFAKKKCPKSFNGHTECNFDNSSEKCCQMTKRTAQNDKLLTNSRVFPEIFFQLFSFGHVIRYFENSGEHFQPKF